MLDVRAIGGAAIRDRVNTKIMSSLIRSLTSEGSDSKSGKIGIKVE
jgi:hypothetical protein